MENFVKAIGTSEIPSGQGRTVDVQGTSVAVFNINDHFCALANTCPHRGGPLGEGKLEGNIVTCPWHGWQFDVTTGISPVNPAATVKKFECQLKDGDLLILLPT